MTNSFLLQVLRHPRIYVECMGYLKLSLWLTAQAFHKENLDEDYYNCFVLHQTEEHNTLRL